MKRFCHLLFFFLLVFLFPKRVFSQEENLDVIISLPNDTVKVRKLYQHATTLWMKDSARASELAEQVLAISEKIGFIRGRALAYLLKGQLAFDRNLLESSLELLKKSLTLAELTEYSDDRILCYYWIARCYRRLADYQNYHRFLSLLEQYSVLAGNKQYLSYAHEGFGNLYRYLGDYPKSIEYYNKAIDLSEELGNMQDVSMALNNLSLVYEYQGKIEEELKIQLRNYEILQKYGRKKDLVLCLSNLAATYAFLNLPEKASDFISRAIEIIDEVGEENLQFKDVASAYDQLASQEMAGKNYSKAMSYYQKALDLRILNKDTKGICESYGNLGGAYFSMKDYASARQFIDQQLAITEKIGYINGRLQAYISLQELEQAMGNYKAAFTALKQVYALKDSIAGEEILKRTAELEVRMKVKDQQEQIKLLSLDSSVKESEIQRRKLLTYILGIGICFVLLLAGAATWGYQQKRRANNNLESLVMERTQKLDRKNKDLKDFVYRSAHDLRAPVATIKGMINIAKDEAADSQIITDYLSRISDIVEKQDTLLQSLLKTSVVFDRKLQPESINIGALTDEILEKLSHQDYASGIEVIKIVDPDLYFTCDRLLLEGIIENLLNNAMKYKRRQTESSFVKVELTKHNEGLSILVSDNGQGIAADLKDKVFELFTRASTAQIGFGLGLYIVRNSVEKLGGYINLQSELRVGSTFSVWLPANSPAHAPY